MDTTDLTSIASSSSSSSNCAVMGLIKSAVVVIWAYLIGIIMLMEIFMEGPRSG